jgi:hypothetical protein
MDPDLVLALGVAAWALVYAASCRWWPWARCLRCHGEGKRRRGDRKVWRTCPRCHGTGRRLRIGRLILNHLSDDARTATEKE